MLITEVSIDRYFPSNISRKGVRAEVTITVDNMLMIHGVRVIDGEKGRFVAMPSKEFKTDGVDRRKYTDIVHPIVSKLKDLIDTEVLGALAKHEDKLRYIKV